MGTDGIEYMIQSSQNLPVDVHFMLPSCVPATEFDAVSYTQLDVYKRHVSSCRQSLRKLHRRQLYARVQQSKI